MSSIWSISDLSDISDMSEVCTLTYSKSNGLRSSFFLWISACFFLTLMFLAAAQYCCNWYCKTTPDILLSCDTSDAHVLLHCCSYYCTLCWYFRHTAAAAVLPYSTPPPYCCAVLVHPIALLYCCAVLVHPIALLYCCAVLVHPIALLSAGVLACY